MRRFFIYVFLFVLSGGGLFGQTGTAMLIPSDILACLNNSGKNNDPTLTTDESQYLNFVFKDKRNGFDFVGKRIAFFSGNIGSVYMTKMTFFEKEKHSPSAISSDFLNVFTGEEAYITGYDAAIIRCTSKKRLRNKEIIRNLARILKRYSISGHP